jgi:hypothetical protein
MFFNFRYSKELLSQARTFIAFAVEYFERVDWFRLDTCEPIHDSVRVFTAFHTSGVGLN